MGGTIFISYRRGEDAGFAGRLHDRLERAFRRHRLFMDVDDIAPGEDFVAVLEARVAECDVLLALIGRGWLTATDPHGGRRVDNPEDFVRIEVSAALAQGKRVIPVLIGDAPMPRTDQLPDDLKPLARRQATHLTHERFKADSTRLIRVLKQVLTSALPAAIGASGEGAADAPKPDVETPAHSSADLEAVLRSPQPELAHPPADAAASLSRARERAGVRAAAAPKLEQKNGIHIGADWHDLPDFAVFKDIDAPWCPEMVVIPAGTFLMGSPPGEAKREEREGPQHPVTISRRFALGRYAVTFDEYDHFCEATKREKLADAGWGRGRHPVIRVSWEDAQAYLAWLSVETGHSYRLPSEAEWEYACRAGTTTPFSFGATITPEQVNYDGNYPYGSGKKGLNRAQTVLVGNLPANPWGLHEMHGNVWEWCLDGMRDYSGAAVTDPLGPTGAERVLRGGSWYSDARSVRSACRSRSDPGFRHDFFGFRCARVQEP